MQTNRNSTRRSLLVSATALILSIAMLVGTTFAWFTDTASTGVNKIQAGNLDLVVEHKNAKTSDFETIEDKTNLFKDVNGADMKWEPGAMSWETFKVSNAGSLAFKYVLQTNITAFNTVNGTGKSLKDVLKVKVLPGSNLVDPTRESVAAMAWSDADPTLDSFVKGDGKLYPNGTTGQISSEEFQVIVYWMPTANDNDWNVNNNKTTSDRNPLFIDFGIKVLATQLEHESDSFDNTYDKNATYSESVSATVVNGQATTFSSNVTPLNEAGATTTVEFPASVSQLTDNSTPELTVVASPTVTANNKFTLTSGNGAVGAIDLTLTVDGDPVTNFTNDTNTPVEVTVTTYVAKGLENPKLYYNGVEVTGITYESDTGKLVFNTTHFSTYVLEASNEAYIAETNMAYSGLQDAVNSTVSGQTVVLLKDVSRNNLNDGKNGALVFTKNIVFDGAGHKMILNTATRGIWIDADNVEAVIKNLTIDGRTSRNGERAVQVYQNIKNAKLTIKNCDLSATMYTINIMNGAEVDLNISDSTITGYGAINLWSATYNVTVNDSTLTGINDKPYDADGWNGFGTVVLEGDTTNETDMGADGLTVSITNSIIDTQSTTGNIQKAILFNAHSRKNIVNIVNTEFKYNATGEHSEAILYVDNGIENQLNINGELKNSPVYADALYAWEGLQNPLEVSFKNVIQDIGYDLCDGEWITLTKNVNLDSDIIRTALYNENTHGYDARGTISITFGNYGVTGGKVFLAPEVTVKTDKEVNCFYAETGELITGELITGESSDSMWVYNASE